MERGPFAGRLWTATWGASKAKALRSLGFLFLVLLFVFLMVVVFFFVCCCFFVVVVLYFLVCVFVGILCVVGSVM